MRFVGWLTDHGDEKLSPHLVTTPEHLNDVTANFSLVP